MTSARETRPPNPRRIVDEPIHDDEGGGEARRLAPPWASSQMNEEDDRRGVNAVSRRRSRRPGINGVPAVISRSGARARAPTAAYDPRRRKGGWIARADRVSESTELPLEGF